MGFYFCSLYCLQNLGQLFSKNHLLFSTEPTSICVGCCAFPPTSFFLSFFAVAIRIQHFCKFVYCGIRNRVAVLSISRLLESGLVCKNRESYPDMPTAGAFNPAIQTPNTTDAICLSEHLADSKLFKDSLWFVFPLYAPFPSAALSTAPDLPGSPRPCSRWACTTSIPAVTAQTPGQNTDVLSEKHFTAGRATPSWESKSF